MDASNAAAVLNQATIDSPDDTVIDGETERTIQMIEYFELLMKNYSIYRKDGDYCDVTLIVGEKVFQCHRLVLASNSKYFVSLFKPAFKKNLSDEEENTWTLPTDYVDPTSFSKLLDAMYGDPLEIRADDLIPLFTTSLYLQLTHFIDQCTHYIRDNLEKIDAIELIMLPQLQFDRDLYTRVKKYLCRNFATLHPRMVGVPLEVIKDLFSDPELFVTNRNQLVDFSKQWILYDIENRKVYLQHVASLLKPCHTPSPKMLKLVEHLAGLSPDDYSVEIALNALLDWRDINNNPRVTHDLLSTPLFFVQPNDDAEVIFGTYRNDSWEFWNEQNQFNLPVAADFLQRYEGATTHEMIYFAGERKPDNDRQEFSVLFQGLNVRTREWVELLSPRSMPSCLVTCNSAIYSYEDSVRDHYQLSMFEPAMNRWFRLPRVNYPRAEAGIATSDHVLYIVGGKPSSAIDSLTPRNIIEMYDTRRGSWSHLHMSLDDHYIYNVAHNKVVTYLDQKLFIVEARDDKLIGIDLRNNRWLELETEITTPVKYLITVDNMLWNIPEDEVEIEVIYSDGETIGNSIPNHYTLLMPISMPYT